MTAKHFSNALGNVNEKYVDEAATYTPKTKKKIWVKWVSIAACFSLIAIGITIGSILHSPDTTDKGNNIASYFVITAQAANGESMDLSVADSCLNSGTAQGNIFGVDMPTFHFDVRPSDIKSNEAIYERFDISISYNETVVEWNKDEHIMVAYLISTQQSDVPWAYSIIGWFTEPTDVVINILDKESRKTVESITVNVTYLADKQEYELKVTDLTTEFPKQ